MLRDREATILVAKTVVDSILSSSLQIIWYSIDVVVSYLRKLLGSAVNS